MHLIRNCLDYASWKQRKALAAAIKPIYTAPSAEAAQAELDAFEQGAWGRKFPTVVAAWRRAWSHVIPFFAFPPAVRKVIYTTNAIESINARLRKIIKTRGHFPSDDAANKLIWLALRNITADWGRAAKDWKEAEPIRDSLRGPIHQRSRVICGTDLPTAAAVRRQATTAAVDKSSSASHTRIQTLPSAVIALCMRQGISYSAKTHQHP